MIKSHSILSFILALFVSVAAFGQNANISGIVLDEDKLPVENALVEFSGTKFSTTTDNQGAFKLNDVPFGNYTLSVYSDAHVDFSKSITVNQNNQTIDNISLSTLSLIGSSDDIPTISLSDDDLDDITSQSISGLLTANRDAFTSAAAYTFSSARFRIRGYDFDNSTTYMNGMPMTDIESGRTMFYTWTGLNDMTRSRESSLGLLPSTYHTGTVGGSSAMYTHAAKQRKQLQAGFAASNRSYNNRFMLSWGSGIMKGGWAVSALVSKRWAQEGFVDGTTYDAYGYFVSVEKIFNKEHSLSLTSFGSPNKRGSTSGSMQELYDLSGTNFYNPYWGYQNGEKRNSRVRKSFQPVTILSHDWRVNNNTRITTAAGYVTGFYKRSGLDWFNAPDPRPNYYRKLPSYYDDPAVAAQITSLYQSDPDLLQINWNELYQANFNSLETVKDVNGIAGNDVTGLRARYIVQDQVTDINMGIFNTSINTSISENLDLQAGFSYQSQASDNYEEVVDLLGADFYVDLNQYAEQDFPDDPDALQNDLNNPNRLLREGDKFGYNYTAHVNRANLWWQQIFRYSKVDFHLSSGLTFTEFWREGNVRYGIFPESSFGDSKKQNFTNFNFKGGATYKINGRNFIVANGTYLTRAPHFRNAYISVRTRDQLAPNLKSETIRGAEAGYQLKSPTVKATAMVYFTEFLDQTYTRHFYHEDFRAFTHYTLTNVDKIHRGLELAAEFKAYKGLTLVGVAALGEHYYNSRPIAFASEDNSVDLLVENELVYAKKFRVANGPQTAYTFGLNYRDPKYWFANLNVNFYDDIFIDFNPVRRTEAGVELVTNSDDFNYITQQEQADNQITLDFFGGKSWKTTDKVKGIYRDSYVVLTVGVSNILDNTDFVTGGYEQLRFDFDDKNLNLFKPRYFYMYGRTYFINLALRMN